MANEMFFHHFPEVAKAETRTLTLPEETDGVPPDQYAYMDSYCTDPKCDCRRVLLFVDGAKHGIVATISYGFDRNDSMKGPFIDPMNKRAPFAAGVLTMTRLFLLSDPLYVARLERHYQMIKEKCGSSPLAANKLSPRERAEQRKASKRKQKRHRPS